ncbi:MAG: Tex family protein [Bacteroidota bacterium]|nr:Tex family protein [Bacteroidota bacterium]
MNIQTYIQGHLQISEKQILSTLELLNQDNTIPFIARYRKDITGNLDEITIENIAKLKNNFENICTRKEAILKSIIEQNALTDILKSKIEQSFDLNELEDLYLPFKKRKETKADVARKLGLEPLAKIIMSQNRNDIESVSEKFLTAEVPTTQEAIEGALHIVAQWINENTSVRRQLRNHYKRNAVIQSKKTKKNSEDTINEKYEQYFDWSESLHRIPSHRLLGILRAEKEAVVKINVSADQDEAFAIIERTICKNNQPSEYIQEAITDSYKRLLAPSLSNEVLQEAKAKADDVAIGVFADNLQQLLLGAPLGEKRILALDPGFRTGCKLVCLDQNGNLLHNETIFPNPPQNEVTIASKKVKSLVNAYKIEAIAIGNGTASRETENFIKHIGFDRDVQVFVVNEAGASVYSASKIARDEFPQFDVTVRGAISIGRRLADPLSELVKIEPKSIGVGQYQHDVDQNKLKSELDNTTIRCVNAVGVNLNTASAALLSYVSGIGEKLAEKIVEYRNLNGAFTERKQLKKVPRLGDKAFLQAAAFLRIKNQHPLDDSAVHPEAYHIVEDMAKDLKVSVNELIGNKELVSRIQPEKYIKQSKGIHYINDILKELIKPGLDPRKKAKILEFDPTIKTINDLKEGMILNGIINNITNFGCFVDIGIKENGLVHISEIKDGFTSDISQVVKLHQHVQVKVLNIDIPKKRIQLSMKL